MLFWTVFKQVNSKLLLACSAEWKLRIQWWGESKFYLWTRDKLKWSVNGWEQCEVARKFKKWTNITWLEYERTSTKHFFFLSSFALERQGQRYRISFVVNYIHISMWIWLGWLLNGWKLFVYFPNCERRLENEGERGMMPSFQVPLWKLKL